MIELYGASWIRERGKVPSSTWIQAIGRRDAADVKLALVKVAERHRDWPPTLPQFLACLLPAPEDFGAPPVAQAWREARAHAMHPSSHAWSHDAIVMAGRAVGWGDLHAVTGYHVKALESAFEAEYLKACELVASGTKLLTNDDDSPGKRTERASTARADDAAADYQGISGAQALRLMKTMTKGSDQ